MDALTLNKWTRFAEKGGIGKAQGRHDVLATVKGDLMFMKDEIIVVLKVLEEDQSYLGACEGVIGRFKYSDVVFLQKQLKKPVFVPHNKKPKQSAQANKAGPGPMVIVVPPQPPVSPRNEHLAQQAGPLRQRTITEESTQTVSSPPTHHSHHRAFPNGTETPTTADTFRTASSTSPLPEAFSPIFHAHPQHTRHTPHPILVPSSLQAGSHVSLTASQPGTASSTGGTTDFSSISSPVRSLSQTGETSYMSMESGWEASSSRSSMDVYVEAARGGREGSGSDVATPTAKTLEADPGRETDAGWSYEAGSAKINRVELERPLGSSTSASSAETNASFDFKAHASFRASNPFALDTGLSSWSGSERGSSPATASVDERDDLERASPTMLATGSQARTIPSRFAMMHDDDDEDDHRRAEWESRVELSEPDLKMSSSGTHSSSVSTLNSMNSINSYLSGSSGPDQDTTIVTAPSREAQGTFGRSASTTGLASQLRAKLKIAPAVSLPIRRGWDTPSPTPSPTPLDAPAKPPIRRVESERKAGKAKRAKTKEMVTSQSQPLPKRSDAPASKRTSFPPANVQTTLDASLAPTAQPTSTNHTLSDIYSEYRGKLGSSRSEQGHDANVQNDRVPHKKLLARRSQSLSYARQSSPDLAADPSARLPSLASTSYIGLAPQHDSRSHEGYLGDSLHSQDGTLATDPSSASGSLLSCLSSNSDIEPVLMTPHLSFHQGQSHVYHGYPGVRHDFDTGDIERNDEGHLAGQKKAPSRPTYTEPREEETSIGATAIARRRRAFTLRGEMSTDLSKARNPIPIRFFIGDAGDNPASPRHGRAVTSPTVRSETDKEDPHPGPSTPFFPQSDRNAPGTSFTRMEVPLPLHQSPSTQSMMQAYDGVDVETSNKDEQYNSGRETVSPLLHLRNSVRKRSLSLKRSQPQLRVDTDVSHPPPIPLSAVKSEKTDHPSALRGSLPLPIPINTGTQNAKSKLSVAGSLSESSPISSKDYFKTERYNDTQFTMNEPTDTRNWQQDQAAEIDEWGFVGNSPVPAIFATKRADPKLTAKLEQNILATISKPMYPASVKKIRKLVWEQSIPSSLRYRVWNWLQPPSSAGHGRSMSYRAIADQVVVPVRKDRDLPLFKNFGTHRSVISGTFPIQEMSHVYACRHPKISLAFDTTWLAAIFASQAFDTEQAYWLYESLLDHLAGEFKPIAIRVTSVVLPQLLAQQDPQLHADLLKKGFDSASYGALLVSWYPSIFASALPFPTVLRLMDILIVEGPLLLLRAALAILLVMSKRLASCNDKDAILRQLLQPSADDLVSPESLVKMMTKVSLSDKVVEGLKNKALASLANQRRN